MIVNTCSSPHSSLEPVSNSITHPQELQNPLQSPKKHRCRASIFSAREMSEQPYKLLGKDHWARVQAMRLWTWGFKKRMGGSWSKEQRLSTSYTVELSVGKMKKNFNLCFWGPSGHSHTCCTHKHNKCIQNICTHVHMCIHKYMHVQTYIHWIHTCTHKHSHQTAWFWSLANMFCILPILKSIPNLILAERKQTY